MQNTSIVRAGLPKQTAGTVPSQLCFGSATSAKEKSMNRNVTIGLGTLIIIIIIVALVF